MSALNVVAFVAAVVLGFMLAEWRVSRQNERRLRAAGAIEPRGDVYRAMAVLYPASFILMTIEGAWRASFLPAPAGGPSWATSGVLLFAVSKALKYWAIRSLRERWSFRVLVQPGRPLVRSGPYAFVSHPNYIAVVGELVATAMMVGAPVSGPLMLAVFGVVLWRRIQFESAVLKRGTGLFSTDRAQKGTGLATAATSDERKA